MFDPNIILNINNFYKMTLDNTIPANNDFTNHITIFAIQGTIFYIVGGKSKVSAVNQISINQSKSNKYNCNLE